MTPRKRKPTLQKEEPPAKRVSKGRAVKKQDDPVWATQNSRSHLVNQDLHAKYSDPQTYANWTKEDWEEIHDCLPEGIPFNDDGYSVSMNFFRYNQDWRRHIREFQEDLGAGRYEPEWLKEATLAMEERAAGKFDKFKEDEFEAFWGQKQTISREVRAGESAKIKLSELVEGGLIKLGDDLSYRRSFRSKTGTLLMIEKDVKVVSIKGTTLTVAIPTGQSKFAHFQNTHSDYTRTSAAPDVAKKDTSPEAEAANEMGDEGIENGSPFGAGDRNIERRAAEEITRVVGEGSDPQTSVNPDQHPKVLTSETLGTNENLSGSQTDPKSDDFQDRMTPAVVDVVKNEGNSKESETILKTSEAISSSATSVQKKDLGNDEPTSAVAVREEVDLIEESKIEKASAVGRDSSSIPNEHLLKIDSKTGCILYDVGKPSGLERKIIQIDSRMGPKDTPIASCWKYIRLIRKNQDLGSLFDIREEQHVWQSSTIVKMPKKKGAMNVLRDDEDASKDHSETPRRRAKSPSKKRGPESAPRSDRKPKRSKNAREMKQGDSDIDDVAEESDDHENFVERESDGDFDVKVRPKQGTKERKKPSAVPKKSTRRALRNTELKVFEADDDKRGHINGDDGGKGESDKNEEDGPKRKSTHTHWCPHCGTGFTKAWSVKNHLLKACKKKPE